MQWNGRRLGVALQRLGGWVAVATVVILAVVLIVRIIWAPTNIGTTATESDALIRSNERLLEMVKWTISTILLIGGGLIGLNWYFNEHRYREDQNRTESTIAALKRDINLEAAKNEASRRVLEQMLRDTKLDVYKLTSQISQTMLLQDEMKQPGGYVGSVLRLLDRPDATDIVRRHAIDTVIFSFKNEEKPGSFASFLGAPLLNQLAEAAANHGLVDQAKQLRELHERYSSAKGV